jgi:hypothetical protein
MDAVQAVIDLVRKSDELNDKINTYESMFNSLIGAQVTFRVKEGKKTRYYECTVEDWNGDGWELERITEDDGDDYDYFLATFADLVEGNLWIKSK